MENGFCGLKVFMKVNKLNYIKIISVDVKVSVNS